MKSIKQHISLKNELQSLRDCILERLVLSKNRKYKTTNYTLFPKTKEELWKMVNSEIEKNGNECSLNHIDVSQITDMEYLFHALTFNGDMSEWDVSNVTNMHGMFVNSDFTGENGDISGWDVSNVTNMIGMFYKSKFNGDISGWAVSNVTNMYGMFFNTPFNGDISNWDVSNVENMDKMFDGCPLENNPPKWYNK